ncbi:MAG: hypothetical protein LBN29_10315 [Mediterranea sp.]|jgi:hypothetical protein|nr:hypothetical protein [Mediterranea sp.]
MEALVDHYTTLIQGDYLKTPFEAVGLIYGLHYLYQTTGMDKYEDMQRIAIDRMIQMQNENHLSPYNLAALCLALDWTRKGSLFDGLQEDIDEFLFKECKLMIMKNNFDYFYGATNLLFYLMQRGRGDKLPMREYKSCVIKCLESGDMYVPFTLENGERVSVINIGVPHGLSGILLLTLMSREKGVEDVDDLIVHLCDILLNMRFSEEEEGYHLFPMAITNEGRKIRGWMGWCSGDIMISYAILKAGILLENSYYIEAGYRFLHKMNNRVDYNKQNLSLCHGYSSLIYIFQRIYELTNDTVFLTRSLFFRDKATDLLAFFLANQRENEHSDAFFRNPSFFTGFPGCFLALSTLDTPYTKWVDCLLL